MYTVLESLYLQETRAASMKSYKREFFFKIKCKLGVNYKN